MSATRQWLRDRGDVPPALLERMDEAIDGEPLSLALAHAGLDALRRVLASDGSRAAALDLLAADALLTHAFEAAAEEGDDALAALTRRLSAETFAALLDPEAA